MLTTINYIISTLIGLDGNASIKSQKGVTMIEYALIAALVAVVVITALNLLGGSLTDIFTNISETLDGASGTGETTE